MKHLILIFFFIPLFVFAQSVDKQWIEKGTKQVAEMTLLKEQGLQFIETSAMITKGVESGSITTDEASILFNQQKEVAIAIASDISQAKAVNFQSKEQLARFSTIMKLILNELKPYQKEVEKIYDMNLTEKGRYLKLFELYLDKTVTQ